MTHCAQDVLSPRRLRLQQGEILISASFGTVQVPSTTPVLPFRQYLAATTLVPDYGLGGAGGVASRHVVHATSCFCLKRKNCRASLAVLEFVSRSTSLSLNLQMVPLLTVSAFDSSMGLSQSEFKNSLIKFAAVIQNLKTATRQ